MLEFHSIKIQQCMHQVLKVYYGLITSYVNPKIWNKEDYERILYTIVNKLICTWFKCQIPFSIQSISLFNQFLYLCSLYTTVIILTEIVVYGLPKYQIPFSVQSIPIFVFLILYHNLIMQPKWRNTDWA